MIISSTFPSLKCVIENTPNYLVTEAYTFGQNVPVCLVMSDYNTSYKTVFYPAVDEFTLLEVDNSWVADMPFWGANLGHLSVSLSLSCARSISCQS